MANLGVGEVSAPCKPGSLVLASAKQTARQVQEGFVNEDTSLAYMSGSVGGAIRARITGQLKTFTPEVGKFEGFACVLDITRGTNLQIRFIDILRTDNRGASSYIGYLSPSTYGVFISGWSEGARPPLHIPCNPKS